MKSSTYFDNLITVLVLTFVCVVFAADSSINRTFMYSAELFVQSSSITAEFEITLSLGLPPLTVFFDASSTTVVDGNAEGLSYVWIFADGSTAEGVEVAKIFSRAGETDVLLTVSDGNAQAQVQKTITVQTPENEDGTLTMRPEEGYVFSKHGVAVLSFNGALEETVNITIEEAESPEEVINTPNLSDDRVEVISPIYSISSDKEVIARRSRQSFGLAITIPEGVDPSELAIVSVTRGKYTLPPLPNDVWGVSSGTYLPNLGTFHKGFTWLTPEPIYIALVRTDGGFFCTGSECGENP